VTEHIDLDEDEDWVAALMSDGWSGMGHAPHNWEVDAHIRCCFGQADAVLHERLSKFVQLDVHVIRPTAGRDFTTYVTSGMSDLAMNVPDSFADWRRAELVIALPGSPETHFDQAGRRHYLIDHLRNYARRPHALGSCFILGDTIGPFEGEETIGPDTRLSAYILARPVVTALEPIYADELDLKLNQGSDVLIARLEAANAFELYDPDRPSVATQKARGFSLKRLLGGQVKF